MLEPENPNSADTVSAAETPDAAPTPQRRTRRTSRAVAAQPDPAPPPGALSDAASDAGAASDPAGAPEPDAPAPKRSRSRARKTPEPTAEAVTAPDETGAETAATEAAAEPGAEAAPVRRKRATKRAAAQPEPEPATSDTDQPPAAAAAADPAPPTAEADPAPPTAEADPAPPRRRRSARKAAADVPAQASVDAPVDPDVAGEPGQPDVSPGDSDVLTAPAVLFVAPAEAQAPTRRRRAAVPVEPIVDEEVAEAVVAEVVEEPEEVREVAAEEATGARRRRRRGRRGRGGKGHEAVDESDDSESDGAEAAHGDESDGEGPDEAADEHEAEAEEAESEEAESGTATRRRRRRRRKGGSGSDAEPSGDDPPNTVVHVRDAREAGDTDGVRGVKGSTRLEAKRQRRRDGRESGRRRPPILSESEFLARREAVDRVMAVRQNGDRTQIAVLEDDILVEHYVTRATETSYVGNVYLGRVQNVLPSMEAAFVDIGKGRNGVLYAGEVNWDAAGLEGKARAIENALSPGDTVLIQVTKDPIGHKGARLTSQISLPGRFLVYVPGAGMTGISRKLPDTERHRLKSILKKIVPEDAGVIIRTAAEGASEQDLTHDVDRLKAQWEAIRAKADRPKAAPSLVYSEPDLAIRVVRDIFNEDFRSLVVAGEDAWATISGYVADVAPDLAERVSRYTGEGDLFHDLRVDEQLAKALDRKVYLPSGGSLVIDRTEAMTVIDVNTGKFVGSGGNLEQTVTRNNIEAAEEIVRQLRLRDVGGIVVIDFIDMVLESNRELVLRRLTECLGRDRTKHQVAEVTSLGLVQMTRKRVGEGLLEAFSEVCPTCGGRGLIVHADPVVGVRSANGSDKSSRKRGRRAAEPAEPAELVEPAANEEQRRAAASAMALIAAALPVDDLTDGVPAPGGAEGVGGAEVVGGAEAEGGAEAADEVAEPDVAERVAADAAVPVAESSEVPAPEPVGSTAPEREHVEAAEQAPPRRRRRAASRPAGPPVTAGVE